ncbi:sugar ABC transporter substrate-binding protein [Labrys miyagiensis]|uniref:Sugar ABC transporter substrate-binding protein n=1 Tax=Labrys miyagiensis TaxID=346912 RepID=A0ABQ6CF30_9HYPH|nr:sugar ABC transporter substrate-binding protein [Labrys miyagiensis]GLS18278.1 sugar ABC transporter substrate-binding protein [Labrys miyagiensis]
MRRVWKAAVCAAALVGSVAYAHAETLTIATVNNGDMLRMQKLTDDFTKANPDIQLNWVTLEENALRDKVTQDIATKAGQFDILTIGTYEVPIWAKKGWLAPLDFDKGYDVDDLLPPIRAGLSYDGKLYAAPFYGESSFTMYRKDLLEKAGLKMPEQPTWDFVKEAAQKMNDPANGVYGVCLRGKAGWGENMAFIDSMANSFGARWFDENWKPQFDQPEWKATLTYYVDLMKNYGPQGAPTNGFQENLTLFNQGKCGIWIDATSAGSFVVDPKQSTVSDKVGFAVAPNAGLGKGGNWLWAWSLAIPASSKKIDAAQKFLAWATSKQYLGLVAKTNGWSNVPPGTRTSLYKDDNYLQAAPFAKITLDSIMSADPNHPTVKPVPYVGVQFVAIPEFQGLGTNVGQQFSSALAGTESIDDALSTSQDQVTRVMTKAGYIK